LKGSWETLVLNIGTANDGLIKLAADGLAKGNDMFSSLSATSQQALSLAGGGAAVAGGALGAYKLTQQLLGLGGSSVALTGSATALTGAAEALTLAAARLGAGGAAGTAADLAGAKGSATGKMSKLGGLGFLGAAGLGIGAMIMAPDALDYVFGENKKYARTNMYKPGRDPRYNHGLSPSSWGAGGLDVSGGLGGTGSTGFTSNREKTWSESLFGGGNRGRPAADPTRMNLPSFGAGAKQMPAAPGLGPSVVHLAPDTRLEATVKPDQIQATLDGRVPVDVTGKVEAELKGAGTVNVTVKVDGPGHVAGVSTSSSGNIDVKAGFRPGATSMPGAATTPGAR
jgi:hypothetical protein